MNTPNIPEGSMCPHWCCVEIAPGRTRYRVLEYANRYEMPCSDSAEPPEGAIPVPGSDEDYYWSGWIEFSCEHCETHWTFSGKVLSWVELPSTDDSFASFAALRENCDRNWGEANYRLKYMDVIGSALGRPHVDGEDPARYASECAEIAAALKARLNAAADHIGTTLHSFDVVVEALRQAVLIGGAPLSEAVANKYAQDMLAACNDTRAFLRELNAKSQ